MKRTVLITAVGSFSAEKVIAGCIKEGFRVIGCDIYPKNWVVNSAEVDVFYQAPYGTDCEKYRTFIKEIVEKENISYIFPLTDVEIDVFHHWNPGEEELNAKICISDWKTIEICRNKEQMEAFIHGKKLCHTIGGKPLNQMEKGSLEETSFPLVIKPVNGRSSEGLHIVRTDKEWEAVIAALEREGAGRYEDYLVQPYIEGNVVTVDVVRNAESKNCVCLPRKELLRTLNGCGTTVYVFRDEKLESQCREIAEALNIRGCVNFEFIEACQGQDVVYYFLECNPRFSGGVAFSALAGYDMVKNHINCFTGQEIQPMKAVRNQYLARRYSEYQMGEDK